MSCGEKEFKLAPRQYEEYEGILNGSQSPVTMIVNSNEIRTDDFDLREVIPLQLETVVRDDRCTLGETLKHIHDMGTRRYVLSVDNDDEFRSRCE